MKRIPAVFVLFFGFFYASGGLAQHGPHTHDHDHANHEPVSAVERTEHHHHSHASPWSVPVAELREARERERQHWSKLSALIEKAREAGISEPEMVRVFEFDGRETLNLPRSLMTQIILASLEHSLDKFEIEILTNPPPIEGLTFAQSRSAWMVIRNSFSAIRRLAVALTWESFLRPTLSGIRHPIQLSRYVGAQWSFLRGSYGMAPAALGATVAGSSYLLSEMGESFVNPFHGGCHWNAYLSAALGFSIMSTFRSAGYLATYDGTLGQVDRVRLGYMMFKTHRATQRMLSAILIKQTSSLGLTTLTKVIRKHVMTEALEQIEHNQRSEVDAIARNSMLWADFASRAQTVSESHSNNRLNLFEGDAKILVDPAQTLMMKIMKLAEISANFEAISSMQREDLTKSHLMAEKGQRELLRLLGDLERSFARFRFFLQASIVTGRINGFEPRWLESMLDYKLGLLIDLRAGQDLKLLRLKFRHWDEIARTSHREGQMVALYPTTSIKTPAPIENIPPTNPLVVIIQARSCRGAHVR